MPARRCDRASNPGGFEGHVTDGRRETEFGSGLPSGNSDSSGRAIPSRSSFDSVRNPRKELREIGRLPGQHFENAGFQSLFDLQQ